VTSSQERPLMTQDPIFIHSLFRAGSTYLFKVFRRSLVGYWCYQEPLHEISLTAKNDREALLATDGNIVNALRHPALEKPYFFELYEVSAQCLPHLKKEAIYDGYFLSDDDDLSIEFWRSLISAAKARPVIQECRTASRIGSIRRAVGGIHLYLWRNPWDQWWSFRVSYFFDAASQLFINAPKHPEIIKRLREEIGFEEYLSDDLWSQIEWFLARRLTPDDSYLVFYVLWCLGLLEGMANADLLLNIDRLSDTPDYRQEVLFKLKTKGIDGLDFSDCSVPQACYGDEDRTFFSHIENKAHGLLLLSGTTQHEIDKIVTLRRTNEPAIWENSKTSCHSSNLLRDAERARTLARRFEGREVEMRTDFTRQLTEQQLRSTTAETKAQQAETKLQDESSRAQAAEAKAEQAEAKLQDESSRAQAAEAKAEQAEAKALNEADRARWLENEWNAAKAKVDELNHNSQHWWTVAEQRNNELQAVYASGSWRITWPLRKIAPFIFRLFSLPIRLILWLFRSLKLGLRWLVVKAMGFVLKRHDLSSKLFKIIDQHPTIKAHLLALAQSSGLIPPDIYQVTPREQKQAAQPIARSSFAEQGPEPMQSDLSPRAARIYEDLQKAMKERNA